MQPSSTTGQRASPRYARFSSVVSAPRAPLLIAGLAFVLSLPAMASGLVADDFDLGRAVTEHPLAAYAFQSRNPVERKAAIVAAREAGSLPWWIDLEFHQAFFRPLSSLSLALDFKLWRASPWVMHLENSLLFAAIVLLAASLYRAFALPARTRGVATFFFAMQGAQSMTTGWISARNTLLATLFGFLTIRLFVEGQRGGRVRSVVAALGAFACALLSAEGGVAAVAYMFAYALGFGKASVSPTDAADPGQRMRLDPGPLARRLRPLLGFGLVIAAWLVVYKTGGYGAKNSGFYVDPSHDPALYLSGLLTAIPIYLASQLSIPYAASAGTSPLALPVVTALSCVILYASRRLWLPWVRRDARARTLAVGAVFAVIPLGASPPQDRMVSFIAFGVCGVIALIVEERLSPGPTALPRRGALRLWRLHAVWAPLLYVPFLFGSLTMIAGGGALLLDRTLGTDPRPVVLVNAPSHLPVHFLATKREWYGEQHPPVDLLYAGGAEVTLERAGVQSLEVAVERGYFASRFERIDRDPTRRPLFVGDTIANSRMRAHVLEARGGAPTRVRFDFTHPLSETRVYAWSGRELQVLPLPKVGERVRLSRASAM